MIDTGAVSENEMLESRQIIAKLSQSGSGHVECTLIYTVQLASQQSVFLHKKADRPLYPLHYYTDFSYTQSFYHDVAPSTTA